MNIITIEYCQKFAISKKGKCLSTSYKNNRTKMLWECDKFHTWEASFTHIKSSISWCPYCCGNKNNSLELCQKIAILKGGICLSAVYENANNKLKWECKKKHQWEATLNKVKTSNTWCPYCAEVARLTLKECQDFAISKKGVCLSLEYKNNREYMDWECEFKHKWKIGFGSIKNGSWCPYCVEHISIETCISIASLKKGKCLSLIYETCDQPLKWQCKRGHIWDATLNNVKNNETWCPKCCFNAPRKQQEIELFIKELGYQTIFNDRKQIAPKELDIFIPEKNIAIEYCGLYWHGEKIRGSNARKSHINKLKLCQEKGIRLITIFEDEWLFKPDQTKGYLKAILGKAENKIGARKCVIKEVDNNTAKQFNNDSHIQGHINGKHIGLYFKDELVCLATFAKPNASRNAFKNNENKIELVRYTNKINYSVNGGLGKLLKYFALNNTNITEIISYSDNRWSNGNLYKALKFEQKNDGLNSPSYYYFNNNSNIRKHRYNWTKHKAAKTYYPNISRDEYNNITEWDIMSKNNWDRIWDCGSSTWILKTNNF